MKVVRVSVSPPPGPSTVPFVSSSSHGTELGRTNSGSNEGGKARAQTELESREWRHAARIVPCAVTVGSTFGSRGFGPKKWLVICRPESLSNTASGVKSIQAKPAPDGEQW